LTVRPDLEGTCRNFILLEKFSFCVDIDPLVEREDQIVSYHYKVKNVSTVVAF